MAIEFGALPPEINSTRMYTGPGPGTLMEAAAAWQMVAAGLMSAGGGMAGITAGLSVSWLGPSSVLMGMSSTQFVAWVLDTAATAEKTAAAALGAAGVYGTAFAATIPPEEVTRNQTTTATLIATNFLGMNSAAIAASEAQYQEYWAQDASAMYAYAADNAALAASLNAPPFLPAIPSTDPLGLASQAAAVGQAAGTDAGQAATTVGDATSNLGGMSDAMGSLSGVMSAPTQAMSAIPQALGQLASPLGSMTSMFGGMNPASALGGGMFAGIGGGAGSFGSLGSVGSVGGVNGGFGGSSVMASMGRAGMTPEGRLSVPAGWGGNAQITTYKALSETSTEAAPAATSYAGGSPRMMAPMMGGMGSNGGGTMVLPNARGVRSGRRKMVF